MIPVVPISLAERDYGLLGDTDECRVFNGTIGELDKMNYSSNFKFCPHCASALIVGAISGARPTCPACHWIQYRNPTVGVAVVVLEDRRLLIGQRRDGGWCIPCGHVEWDEPVEDAAKREFKEETGLIVSLGEVLAVQSNFHAAEAQTVGVWYAGVRTGGELRAGDDLTDVAFVDLDGLPALKFPTDRTVVQRLRSTRV